jgi:formylglycine-generating enzyme required for sulfatase activity
MTPPETFSHALDRLLFKLRAAGFRIGVTEELRLRYLLVSQPDLGADLPLAIAAVLGLPQTERDTLGTLCKGWADALRPRATDDRLPQDAEPELPGQPFAAPRPASRRRGSRWTAQQAWLAGLVLLLALGVSAGGWYWHRKSGPAKPPPVKTQPDNPTNTATIGPKQYLIYEPSFEVQPPPHPVAGWLWLLLGLLGLASGATLVWLRRNDLALPPVLPAPPDKGPSDILPTVPAGDAAPLRLVSLAEQDALIFGIGRFVSEDRTRHLDLAGSVAKTAQLGGCPQLVFAAARYPREVWFWLDDSLALDHPLRRLEHELSQTLRRGGLQVEQAVFYGVPDRLEASDKAAPFCPAELEDHRDSALVCILTEGRILGQRLEQFDSQLAVRALLRGLAHWPHLTFVDGGDGSLSAALEGYGLSVVSPQAVPAFLADGLRLQRPRRTPGSVELSGDLLAWAACCALAPFPLDDELTHEVRTRLALRVSPWQLPELRKLGQKLGARFQLPTELRSSLLRFLVSAEGLSPTSLFGRALAVFRDVIEKTAEREAQGQPDSLAQRRLRMYQALLDLWDSPREGAASLHGLTAGLASELRTALSAYGPRGAAPPLFALPWKWEGLDPTSQDLLYRLGLGGLTAAIAGRRRSSRYPAVVAVLGVLSLGAAVRAWKPAKEAGEPQVQQLGPPKGARVGTEPSGVGYRVYAEHGSQRGEVQTPARARVTVRWVEKKQQEKTEVADWCPYKEETHQGIVYVRVCGGEFTMGSAEKDQEAYESEKPAHRVKLDEFWIGKSEVSNAEYRRHVPSHKSTYDRADQPVNDVSWSEAKAFCEAQGGRLPTEAEWEYAARGRDGRKYPWGDNPPTRARAEFQIPDTNDNPREPASVQSHSEGAGPFGTLNQAGNVWEWVEDCYESDSYRQQVDKHRADGNNDAPLVSPVYVLSRCETRRLRGGSFWDVPWYLRSAYRFRFVPGGQFRLIGVRCVRSVSRQP